VPSHIPWMLTDKPNIVIAHAPKYTKHKREADAVPTRIVGGGKVRDMSEAEHQAAGDDADRLWEEIKRAMGEG